MITAFEKLNSLLVATSVAFRAVTLLGAKIFGSKASVIEQEDLLGANVDELKSRSAGSSTPALKSLLQSLSKQQQVLAATSTRTGIGASATSSSGGGGVLIDHSTGNVITTGSPTSAQFQSVNVQIIADKERLVNAVVTDQQFMDQVNAQFNSSTNDAARATRR